MKNTAVTFEVQNAANLKIPDFLVLGYLGKPDGMSRMSARMSNQLDVPDVPNGMSITGCPGCPVSWMSMEYRSQNLKLKKWEMSTLDVQEAFFMLCLKSGDVHRVANI